MRDNDNDYQDFENPFEDYQESNDYYTDSPSEEEYFDQDDTENVFSDEEGDNDSTKRRRSRNHKQHPIAHGFGVFFKWLLTIGTLGIIAGVGLFAYYAKDAPVVSITKLQAGGSSALYTNDGKLLLTLGSDKRNYLHSDKIPQTLKDAVVSVEDKRFYHDFLGLDPIRIVGSMVANLKGHDISAGGSGITQQLVKLSVFSTDASQRTLRRKAQEAWLAMKISRQYSKEQILEFYINKVYMNYNNFGIGTAANYYYGKPVSKLDLAQTALLAGMPNAPTIYDPYLYPKNAEYRRNIVLQAMLKNGKISQEQYQQALNEDIQKGLRPRHDDGRSETRKIDDPYIKEVVEEAKEKGYDPYNSNLKITINIDQDAQDKLYELANSKKIPFTNDKMQVGATVVNPINGHVVAIIGGRHLPNVQLGLNRAVQTGRSTGSSIKPVLDYAPAIEYNNWSTAQTLMDTPYTYAGTHIQLYDWDNRYYGAMSMRYALEQSRNVPAVRTLENVGLIRASKFVKKMGITIGKNQGLSVAIGANASSLQMAGAYSALADGGIYHKPRFISKIETPDGLVHDYDEVGTRVMKDSTAYMITDMLKGVISKGSGTKAQIKNLHQAGKTGTVKYSDDELSKFPSYRDTPKDSWFIGYTKSYVMSVWTGYDNLSDGNISGSGQDAAQLYYKEMMQYLMKDQDNLDWTKPDSVVARGSALYVKGHAPKLPKPKKKDNKSIRDTRRNSSSSNGYRTYYYYRQPRTYQQRPSQRQPRTNQPQQRRRIIYYYYYR